MVAEAYFGGGSGAVLYRADADDGNGFQYIGGGGGGGSSYLATFVSSVTQGLLASGFGRVSVTYF